MGQFRRLAIAQRLAQPCSFPHHKQCAFASHLLESCKGAWTMPQTGPAYLHSQTAERKGQKRSAAQQKRVRRTIRATVISTPRKVRGRLLHLSRDRHSAHAAPPFAPIQPHSTTNIRSFAILTELRVAILPRGRPRHHPRVKITRCSRGPPRRRR